MKSKRHILQSIWLLFLLAGFCQCAIAQHEPYLVRTTAGSCAHVRSQARSTSASLTCLPPGTAVTVVQAVPFWREIIFGNNQRGWIAKKYLEPAATTPVPGDATIPDSAFLSIHYVDVGQGDAIWIQTYDDGIDGNGKFEGYSIVIDGGPYSSDNSNPLLPYMESQGHHGADIEALLITHPHIDHFSGAETVSRHFHVNHYYDPGYPSTVAAYKNFLKTMQGINGHPGRAKQVHLGKDNFGNLDWGSELKVEILYAWDPAAGHQLGSGNTIVNNASIVLRVQYGEHVFLFMGDAEGKDRHDDPATAQYVEKVLLETMPEKLKATVLKIAHHGSETSSSVPFIEAVDPDIVVVQSGRKSFSGTFLPDKTTLKRYCTHRPGVKIYRTDQGDEAAGLTGHGVCDGDHIVIRSNGKGQPVVKAPPALLQAASSFCNQ